MQNPPPILPGGRKPVGASAAALVQTSPLTADGPLPLLVTPAAAGVDLALWAEAQRDLVESHLHEHGGVLFRGFALRDVAAFERFVAAVAGELLEYTYRSTPRTQVSGNIYTSTEYPANLAIPMHNELSYCRSWPLKIAFFCVQPAAEGGETPIADSRRVYQDVDPEVRDELARKGILYVRNLGHGVDLPWQEVFQTEDRGQVERHCRREGIEIEWLAANRLRTRQVCQAVAVHPITGEAVWFNQAHLFHVSSLDPAAQEFLLEEYGEANLPRNTYYGDGSPIPLPVLEHIREVYARHSVAFRWQAGDVLLLDNMLVAHGRRPFHGARQVVVGMAQMQGVGVPSEAAAGS